MILRIDSPGGTTAGSEAVYEAVRKISAKKPVVAVMDTVAASGGYITALAADHIVARGNTITGSIGVIFSFPEVSKLLDTVGIKMEELKSGELKAEPSPYKPVTEKVRAVSMEMVKDGYDWFTGLVAERRQLPMPRVVELSDGRVYTGRQALAVKLIDEIGGEEQAVAWLETEKKLAANLPIEDWKPRSASGRYAASASPPRTWCCAPWGSRGSKMPSRGRNLTDSSCFGTLPTSQGSVMIKSELVQKIAEKNPHLYHRDIERIVNTVLDEIIDALKDGDRVELRGFGAFSAKARNARMGRNPRTGESVEVVAKRVPFFKTGKELRERLNEKG